MQFKNDLDFAQQLDKTDPLHHFREQFLFPQHHGKNVIYFTGNSLGLQPRKVREYLDQELNDWATFGVEGHFMAKNPWVSYHEPFAKSIAKVVGAKESEVVVMNQLTVNLHLLMVSFYQPTPTRYKIICEAKAFPSDQYAIDSQVQFHGYKPEDAVIEVSPRDSEHCIRLEDILECIEKNKDSVALVLFGGVNYYSGQLFDMKQITAAAHKAGAMVGFDLAHAAGNVKLSLHDWNADFACWCSYKYMNSGPGGVSGVFVHERHHKNDKINRFAGWWGHDKVSRFKMDRHFVPMQSAEAWQLSNAPVLSMAAHKAALELFDEAGMDALTKKSEVLTAYLEFIIHDINERKKSVLEIITPSDKSQRGCQLSIVAHGKGKDLFTKLSENGVIADWREPNVIRVAPVPMYNSFEDIYRFGQLLETIL